MSLAISLRKCLESSREEKPAREEDRIDREPSEGRETTERNRARQEFLLHSRGALTSILLGEKIARSDKNPAQLALNRISAKDAHLIS